MTYCWWTNSVQYLNPLNYNVDNLDTKVLHKRLSPLYLSLYLINLPRARPGHNNRLWTPIQTIRKHQHFQKHFQQTQHVRKTWRKGNLDVFYILFRSQKGSLYSRTSSVVDDHIFLLLLRGIRLGISTCEKQWFKTTWAEIFSDHLNFIKRYKCKLAILTVSLESGSRRLSLKHKLFVYNKPL